jgi:hypothetical protein
MNNKKQLSNITAPTKTGLEKLKDNLGTLKDTLLTVVYIATLLSTLVHLAQNPGNPEALKRAFETVKTVEIPR